MSQAKEAPAQPAPNWVRALGPVETTSLVAGTVIGAGIFLLPGTVAATAGAYGVAAILGVWLVCGLLMLAGAFSYAELAAMYPRTGGTYVFIREAYGPVAGFLFGWLEFWIIRAGAIAAVAVGFATYAGYFTHLESDWQLRWTAFLAVFALTILNYLGVRTAGAAQVLFTATKIGLLGALVVCAFCLPGGSWSHLTASPAPVAGGLFPWLGAIGAGMYAVLWSFYGWSGGAAVSEEMKEPRRDAPRALILGTGLVALLYLGVTLAYHYVLPLDRIAGSAHVGADVAEALFGPAGGTLAAAVALIAAFGTVNGLLLSGSRIFFAMGRDGVFFRDMASVHPRFRTPANAIVFQGLWASFLILVPFHNLLRWLPGTQSDTSLFEGLIGFGQCAVWLFFALVSAGVVVLRVRRPDETRPFRAPGYPVVPLLFSAASLAMAIYTLAHQPLQSAAGFGIMLLGLPAYHMFRRADQRAGSASGSIEALTSETLGSWYRPVSDR